VEYDLVVELTVPGCASNVGVGVTMVKRGALAGIADHSVGSLTFPVVIMGIY
jgi:hypothetical protein